MHRYLLLAFVPLLVASRGVAAEPDRAGIEFFEKKIRPVLIESCYRCHSEEAAKMKKLKGDLLLDTRDGVRRGGEGGPILNAQKPADSRLFKALRHEKDLAMPPSKKLSDAIIADFYAHLLAFETVREFLANEALLRRLQATQREYLLGLGRGRDGLSYWETRLRIGMAHERARLPQKWYLGAYAKLFELIRRRLAARHAGNASLLAGLLETLQKIFNLDATLAVETYHQANVHTLKRALQDLTDAQQALQRTARTDGLTGVRNRACLMEGLTGEFERSRRYGHELSLLFIDLDHFKRVNDRHGHARGDEALRKTVEILSRELRSTDILGRFGGEEFLLGLVETGMEAAEDIAERIRRAIEGTTLEKDGHPLCLTVSIGVATLADEVEHVEGLIDRADQALYRAKQHGRNRVCCFEPVIKQPTRKRTQSDDAHLVCDLSHGGTLTFHSNA